MSRSNSTTDRSEGRTRVGASTAPQDCRPRRSALALLDDVRDDFLAEHLASPNTFAAYRADLSDFFAYCDRIESEPLDLRRIDVAGYLQDLRRRGAADSTINRRLVTVRGFFDRAVSDYGLARSPAIGIRIRQRPCAVRRPSLTREGLAAFLAAADATSERAAGLAWLLATTGLRISEACESRVDNLATHRGGVWLTVVCKGNLRREVPLHPLATGRLDRLVEGRASGYIFATRSGKHVDRRASSRLLVSIADEAGVGEGFSPHVLRHTFVTLARGAGCSLEDVQDAAGHADPATTRAYDRTMLSHRDHPSHQIFGTDVPSAVGLNAGLGAGVAAVPARAIGSDRQCGQAVPATDCVA